jgi:spoIIIJ-associated protein
VAHAEASARTVEAAVTAAAAQLGLRSDQVDVEVLEDPVPSTFGYIGSPARVRVTPRQPAAPASSLGDPGAAAHHSPHDVAGVATADQPSDPTRAAGSGQPSDVAGVDASGPPSDVPGVAAGRPSSDAPGVAVPEGASDPVQAAPAQAAGPGQPSGPGQLPAAEQAGHVEAVPPEASDLRQAPGPEQTADSNQVAEPSPVAGSAIDGPATYDPNPSSRTNNPDSSMLSVGTIESTLSSAEILDRPAPAPTRDSIPAGSDSAGARGASGPAGTHAPPPTAASSPSSPAAGVIASEDTGGAVIPDDSHPGSGAGREIIDQAPTSAQSSSLTAAGGGIPGSDSEAARPAMTAEATPMVENAPPTPSASERSNATRPRRAYRDEPIDAEMVEADTERAGDFLEGLLDALDVDGDITTWVDEAAGHVDLEGSDLDVLVGSNGETLDALQELTRIAVLRQSKRRVRLLLDINGFRSRQRDQLISVVKVAADQVIKSREDHEFQPMTPAERKIVHDAVAAIDGVRTESLGEEPYRRVVIRPT